MFLFFITNFKNIFFNLRFPNLQLSKELLPIRFCKKTQGILFFGDAAYTYVREEQKNKITQSFEAKGRIGSSSSNFFLSLLIMLILSTNAMSQTLHATFVEWSVFSIKREDKAICYMVSLPIKKDGSYNKRGEAYFLVTNLENDFEEISISCGYNFKKNSEVELSFGLKKFNIFTYDNLAWANSKTDDLDIVKEMKRNEDVIVLGVASDNSYSKDTYSLVGFLEAHRKMKEICKN